jgi:SPP1 family phage portal protein
MEFVTKNINATAVENHIRQLEENIYTFSQSARFTDETFGAASGISLKFKLFQLEQKCTTAERKFTKALYRMFSVLSGYFDKKGVEYDPWEMQFVFARNHPQDYNAEIAAIAQGKGLISDETLFANATFIDDPGLEKERIAKEQEEYIKASAELAKAEAELNPPIEKEPTTEEAPPGVPQEQTLNT